MMCLELKGLSLSLGGKKLFSQLNYTFKQGDFTILEGESGAGKSSLLRSLSTLQSIDSGQVSFRDEVFTDPVSWRSEVCLLTQQPKLSSKTVKEELLEAFSFAIHRDKSKPDEQELIDSLSSLGLEKETLSRIASSLSPGEQQRVAVLRVLLLEPKCLLLDEPFSALDEKSARKVWEFLIVGKDERVTIGIFHQLYPWMNTSEKLLLQEGQLHG